MDELVDILDAEGNFTGQTAMKSKAHKHGLFQSMFGFIPKMDNF